MKRTSLEDHKSRAAQNGVHWQRELNHLVNVVYMSYSLDTFREIPLIPSWIQISMAKKRSTI